MTLPTPRLTLIDRVNRTKPFLGTECRVQPHPKKRRPLIHTKTKINPGNSDYTQPLLLNNLNTKSIYKWRQDPVANHQHKWLLFDRGSRVQQPDAGPLTFDWG